MNTLLTADQARGLLKAKKNQGEQVKELLAIIAYRIPIRCKDEMNVAVVTLDGQSDEVVRKCIRILVDDYGYAVSLVDKDRLQSRALRITW